MNNPTDPYNSQSSGNDLTQLGNTQSSYINQFMQSTAPTQTPNWQQQSPGSYSQQSSVPASTPVPAIEPVNPISTPPQTMAQSGPNMDSSLPDLNQLPPLGINANTAQPGNAIPQSMPIEPMPGQAQFQTNTMNPSVSDVPVQSNPQPMVSHDFPQTVQQVPASAPSDMPNTQLLSQQTPQSLDPTNNFPTQNAVPGNGPSNYPQQTVPTNPVNINDMAVPVVNPNPTPAPVNQVKPDDLSIGTHQVSINEDYAESFQGARQINFHRPVEPRQIDFSRPATSLTVDHDFSDGSQAPMDDQFTSTGFLPPYDPADDNSLVAVSDDDDDSGLDEGPDAVVPYGFSDFDPDEQTASAPDLGGFESKSLEEVGDNIDVDFSEAVPAGPARLSTNVGVLTQTQSPVTQNNPQRQNRIVYNTIEPVNFKTQSVPHTFTQNQQASPLHIEPSVAQQTPVQPQLTQVNTASNELSPTARLNQLLEAEEAAEKVIMQKQEQMIKQTPKPQTVQSSKVNIFKQLDPDLALQGDLRNGLAVKSPTSRYFLILSLVIIISVIGFLLVLLGLTLI